MEKTISICMIVKNEEEMLEKTLPQHSTIFDELIIVDTGSSDNTIQVAKKFGAKVFEYKWNDDFAAARNHALKQATGDWILFLDADEIVKIENVEKVKNKIFTENENAYHIAIWQAKPDTFTKETIFYRIRLFKNHKGYRYLRPVNGQLADSDNNFIGGPILDEIVVYHWGYCLPKEQMLEKSHRNIKLLSKAIEHPMYSDDALMHYLLADNLKRIKAYPEAIAGFDTAAKLAQKKSLHFDALVRKGWCLVCLRKLNEALACAREVLTEDENNVPALNLGASILLSAGVFDDAINLLKKAKETPMPEKMDFFLDTSQYKGFPSYLLGKAYSCQGYLDDALFHLQQAYKESKTDIIKNEIDAIKVKLSQKGGE